MKKIIVALVLLMSATVLFSSCKDKKEEDDSTSKPSVTTVRDGFEDITAPPEDSIKDSATAENGTDASSAPLPGSGEEDKTFGTEEAVKAARAYLGDVDPDSGFKYAYSFDEMFSDNGTDYFKVRVSWYLEEEDRYSLCGYLLVSADGKSIRKYNW